MAEKQNINVSLLAALGSISTVLLIVTIVAVQAWFYNERDQAMASKSVDAVHESLLRLKQDQDAKLREVRWVDEQQGLVTMPIELAMQQYVASKQNGE